MSWSIALLRAVSADNSMKVMTIAVVDTVDEAIDLANASTYSLTSALWTNDMQLALDVSSRIHAGKVIVNGVTYGTESRFHQAGLGYVLVHI